ncbi:MAG: hypothetical protein SFY81_02340 [Verrucomicrobiota bacterium]|nr:hypothetical protein [Verrucomicrobiota bacterium]
MLKHFTGVFLGALVLYVLLFSCDAHLRSRKGPWEVTFQTNNFGNPALLVNQHSLGVTNLQIILEGETATNQLPQTIQFTNPRLQPPFGRVRFHDLTYLPGTLTFDLYGHEVELLPRALFLNLKEFQWGNSNFYVLKQTDKIPGLKDRDRKGRR